MKTPHYAVLVAMTCWCLSSSAQDFQSRDTGTPGPQTGGGQRVAHEWLPSSPAEKQVAALIFSLGFNEIEIAKFAQSRLQTEMARQFAEKMVREHTPGCESMKRIAGELVARIGGEDHGPVAVAAPTVQDPARRKVRSVRERTEAQPDPSPASDSPAKATTAGSPDWIQIHQQVAALHLGGTKRELATQQGTDFDKGFMVQQVLAHQQAIDTLQVLRKHATAELRRHIDSELQLASAHLQQARQIEQQLQGDNVERTTRRP